MRKIEGETGRRERRERKGEGKGKSLLRRVKRRRIMSFEED